MTVFQKKITEQTRLYYQQLKAKYGLNIPMGMTRLPSVADGFIQYMPMKPQKFGIKVCALCDSRTGYCLCFQIYTGIEGAPEQGLSYGCLRFDIWKIS